jgi:TonB family protein
MSVIGLSLLLHGGAAVVIAHGARAGAAGTGTITFTLVDAPAGHGARPPAAAPAPVAAARPPDPAPAPKPAARVVLAPRPRRPAAVAPAVKPAPRVAEPEKAATPPPEPQVAQPAKAVVPADAPESETAAGARAAQPPQLVPGSCTEQLQYPASGKEGVVRMRVVLDEHGNVVEATVTGSVGFGLDEAALEAVHTHCRFAPARDARGEPIPSVVEHLFAFRIGDFHARPAASLAH